MTSRSVLLVATLVLVLAAPARAATRFLVAVGARVGLPEEQPLRYAHADAERFRDAFVELDAVAPARATVLTDGGVHALELALARLAGQVEEAVRQGERVEVLFYASGHGDADALHLDGARYPIADLEARLKELPAAATVLVLDACRTATVARGRDKGAVRGPAFDVTVQREVAPHGFVSLYAARDGEAAQESDLLEGAYFTHHLVVGLRGAADFDGDKKVTLAEAWRHAHQTTLARSHATASAQHPEMRQALEGEAELVLVELSRAKATLVIPADVAGQLLLVDAASGRVVLEVDKSAGRALDVALPARRVRAQLRPMQAPDTVRIGEIDLVWGGRRVLDPSALSAQPLVAMVDKGASKDPTPWLVTLTAGPALSPLGAPWLGADVTGARRVFETPVFVRARAGAARSELGRTVQNAPWRYTHVAAHGALGAEVELWLGWVRVAGGLDAGAAWVHQEGVRTDAKRLDDLGYATPTLSTWALGPRMALDVTAQLPIAFGVSLVAGARGGGAWLAVDDAPAVLPDGAVFLGMGVEW